MANSRSAKKRAAQNEKKRLQNKSRKSEMRTSIKTFEQLVEQKNVEEATKALTAANKRLDKAASTGIIHKNTAARQKSKLMKQLNELKKASA
jgi:small subunit ribosomal protein S20